jgi:hypothetical protein
MNGNIDSTLSRILKNWVSKHQPPAHGRASLLLKASATPRKRYNFSALIPRTQFNDYPMHSGNANEWAPTKFTWLFEQSFQSCIQARV